MSIKHLIGAGIANAHPSEPSAIRFIIGRGLGIGGVSPGGYTPGAPYNPKREKRLREKKTRERVELQHDLRELVGVSDEEIEGIWINALFTLEENPEQVIAVEHDIPDKRLVRLVHRFLSIGVMDSEKTGTGRIVTPEGSVIFQRTSEGWIFFRIKGSA